MATPFPVIVTDILSGHDALITSVDLTGGKNKTIDPKDYIKVAHPIHTIYIHIYNLLTISDQTNIYLSKQIPKAL